MEDELRRADESLNDFNKMDCVPRVFAKAGLFCYLLAIIELFGRRWIDFAGTALVGVVLTYISYSIHVWITGRRIADAHYQGMYRMTKRK